MKNRIINGRICPDCGGILVETFKMDIGGRKQECKCIDCGWTGLIHSTVNNTNELDW